MSYLVQKRPNFTFIWAFSVCSVGTAGCPGTVIKRLMFDCYIENENETSSLFYHLDV